MPRPLLLDLFCGAGGAAMGYYRAGFDVVGVDIKPQPYYPFPMYQADALEVLRDHNLSAYDAIHASPPCQAYATVTIATGDQSRHPRLLPDVLTALKGTGRPWVIENVPKAIPHPDMVLCGSQFGLRVKRHRHFLLSNSWFNLVPPCTCGNALPFMHQGERAYADAMGCTWMTKKEAREAIPPAYTEYIGLAAKTWCSDLPRAL